MPTTIGFAAAVNLIIDHHGLIYELPSVTERRFLVQMEGLIPVTLTASKVAALAADDGRSIRERILDHAYAQAPFRGQPAHAQARLFHYRELGRQEVAA